MSKMGQVLASIKVAQMVEKEHGKLLKDIRRYSTQLIEGRIPCNDFFKESTYIDGKEKSRLCEDRRLSFKLVASDR